MVQSKKCALELYTPAQAQILHDKGALYCVLIGSQNRPTSFIEVTGDWVGVGFLDEKLREVLTYSFQEQNAQKLFLSMATHREFDSISDKIIQGTSYIFSPNGNLNITREEFYPSHNIENSESTADITKNWENHPKFGEYTNILRTER